jgi:regulator of extracellular matrix RemA (YlzA/DUF370 family)
MSEKVHWKKVVSDPTYIGEADFEPGEEKVLTIASVNTKETVMSAEGKSTKAVVHWVEPEKAMILNVARSKAIQKATGSPWIDDWCGKKVQLYIDNKVKAFGEIVSAVRVRNFPPKAQPKQEVKTEAELICEECGQVIKAAYGLSASEIAISTKKKYNRTLCSLCATAEAGKAK